MTKWMEKLKSRLSGEGGFTLIETIAAIGILFVALIALAYTSLAGFREIAIARQRQTGSQIANLVLERVRGLPYATVSQGLSSSDLVGDPNIVTCTGGIAYFRVCPNVDPNAEQMVHTDGLAPTDPLVPHTGVVGPPAYTLTYAWWVYVMRAVNVPTAGAYRVMAIVSWASPERAGAPMIIEAQTLAFQPSGSTDPDTQPNPGTNDFFYGAGNLSPGTVTATPNDGVIDGTGVSGLTPWTSLTRDLAGIDANLQQEQLTRSDAQVTLNGAVKILGDVEAGTSVETLGGASQSVSTADDDPATSFGTSSTPSSPIQGAYALDVTGGGNSLSTQSPSFPSGCPGSPFNPVWMTGFEHGVGSDQLDGVFDQIEHDVTIDSSVVRSGAYSARLPHDGKLKLKDSLSPTSTLVLRFALRFSALPTSDGELLEVHSGGDHARLGYIRGLNSLYVRWNSNVYATSTVVAGTWYVIDMRISLAADPRTIEWRIDGVSQPVATRSQSSGTISEIEWINKPDNALLNLDDMIVSYTAGEYPIGNGKILGLRPDGMGTSNPLGVLKENGIGDLGANTYQLLDDVPMTSTADYVNQIDKNTSAYGEVTFQDTSETCVRAVMGIVGQGEQDDDNVHGKTVSRDGSVERVVFDGSVGKKLEHRWAMVTPAAATWTTAAVNGLRMRFGYSNNAKLGEDKKNPRWQSLFYEYAVHLDFPTAETPESGFAKSTVPTTNPSTCYGAQTSGPCSYATLSHTSAAPHRLEVSLAGTGAGTCSLYEHVPAAGVTSYVYGRRLAGVSSIIAEDVVRYYGQHTIGKLCDASISVFPVGWPGYLVRYDAGSSPACAKAQAGLSSAAPEVCLVGTISYWNGSGVSTMTQSMSGDTIPVAPLDYTQNGWRHEITGVLGTGPSSIEQVPTSAPMLGNADRTEARSVMGSPLVGSFTYKVTNATTGQVVVDVTVEVDIGSLTAAARHQPQ